MTQKESSTNELHSQAMDIAEVAFLKEKKEKDVAAAIELYEKSYQLEREAAMSLLKDYEDEPSRSVLFQSAANLAFCAKMFREAEQMVGFALSGNPPYPINEELRFLLKKIAAKEKEDESITSNAQVAVKKITKEVKKLPVHLQKEVSDFIEFLIAKHLRNAN